MKRLIPILLISGCAAMPTSHWYGTDDSISNNQLDASLEAPCTPSIGCKYFQIKLTNKTDHDLVVDWNKTVYLQHGQSNGGFMFNGVRYVDRAAPKAPDVVQPGSTFTKVIYPNNQVSFTSGMWYISRMPEGSNGVYLSINDRYIKLTSMITEQK